MSNTEQAHLDGYSLGDEHIDDSDGESNERTVKRSRLYTVGSRTKAKTKKLLKIVPHESPGNGAAHEKENLLKSIHDNPAFRSNKLERKKNISLKEAADKTLEALQTATSTIVNPTKATKSKVSRTTAAQLSKIERPFLSLRADLELLEAHDNVDRAWSSQSSDHASSGKDDGSRSLSEECRGRVEALEARRESLRVAWTTSQIERVRVVPKRHIVLPANEAFVEKDSQGNVLRYQWERWLGYRIVYYTQDFSAQYIDDFDELPFDLDVLRKHVERLVVASEPWQTWIWNVRSVYRWENPAQTGGWLALYVVLWWNQHVLGFFWAYIIYLVLKNRYFPTSVQALRDSTRRSRDRQKTATKLGELVDKHGREKWLEPLIDDLGPFIQLQLGDIANMLEVLVNFYQWKSPRKTASTLWFFASCLMLSVFTDVMFCMSIFWFVVGGCFFICWPISSKYPRYRYLVSPFKWILWDIPTNAEWSFQYLRFQAQVSREQMIKQIIEEDEAVVPALDSYSGNADVPQITIEDGNGEEEENDDSNEDWHSASSAPGVLEGTDIMAFRARWKHNTGRLIICSNGIRFVRSVRKKELWRYSFLELVEMIKIQRSTLSRFTIIPSDQLKFKITDGSTIHVDAIKGRDEAFNSVLGFSGLQWQSLQSEPEKKEAVVAVAKDDELTINAQE